MQYRWIEKIEDFEKISREWDGLVTGGDRQVFLLSDFIITWWRYFGKGKKLRVLVFEEGGKIKAGLPLCIEKAGAREGFADLLRHVGGVAANYTEPLYAGDTRILPELTGALFSRKDWDVFCLTDVREGNRLLAEIKENPGKGGGISAVNDHMNYAIDLREGLDKYLSTLSPKLKRDLKSKRRRITEKFGQVSLHKVEGAEEVGKCVGLYKRYSTGAFAARNKKSNFENERYSDFFRDFLVRMETAGRLDAHILKAGDEVLAISFAYRFGKGFNWVLTAFNYEQKYYRPGYMLIEELLRHISASGETCYNWYGHGRFYKDQLCNMLTPLYRVTIIRKTLKGSSYLLSQKAKNTVKFLRGIARRGR